MTIELYCNLCHATTMPNPTTLLGTVEPNHTVKVPVHLPAGERVLIVRMSSIAELFDDSERRSRFAATHKAIQNAMDTRFLPNPPSNEEIIQLVKKARRATNHS